MPDLIETVEDGVATLTLNRPENLNALSDEIRLGLLEAFSRLGADNAVVALPAITTQWQQIVVFVSIGA